MFSNTVKFCQRFHESYVSITGRVISAMAMTCAATVPVMAPRMKPTMMVE